MAAASAQAVPLPGAAAPVGFDDMMEAVAYMRSAANERSW